MYYNVFTIITLNAKVYDCLNFFFNQALYFSVGKKLHFKYLFKF